ncbi:MAG: aminotransferase class V-fold PLP-dependent enzyme [Planctomycetota bacterium]
MTRAAPVASLDPEQLRTDFPILARAVRGQLLIYLDNAASTQRPRSVIQSIVAAYEHHYANVHRGIHTLAQEADELYEQARERVRGFIGAARASQIIFTSGATSAINLVARSWGDAHIRRGDEVLLSEMEHHANLVPWFQLAQRTGAVVRHIPITDDGRLELERLGELLTERTKLVAVTAVSNVLGTINPVEEIVRRAHAAGATVLIDGAQSVPHQALDVTGLDADFLVFSGHKMLGPSGIGVLYGKEALLAEMPPFLGGGSMIREVRLDGFEPAEPPERFEAGTPPIVPAIGLGAAIEYLERIGLEPIHQHERRLVEHAHQVLADVPGIRILGPSPEHKAGIVSFVLESVHAHDVAELLDQSGIAVRAGHHCAMPLHKRLGIAASARASFYLYNTLAEIDRLREALTRVATSRVAQSGARRSARRQPNA